MSHLRDAHVLVALFTLAGCRDPNCGADLAYDRARNVCTCPSGTFPADGGATDGALCVAGDGGPGEDERDGGPCIDGQTRACADGNDTGECSAGVQRCADGSWSECLGALGPNPEQCDGLDNDCDSAVDGAAASASCGSSPRATSVSCSAGVCITTSCSTGFADCDGDFPNGCEVDTRDSVAHCGGCGTSCAWTCAASECDDPVAIGFGYRHGCAVRASSSVVCWGHGLDGQIGNGLTTSAQPTPAVVVDGGGAAMVGFREVGAGFAHTCGLRLDGSVWCWGQNRAGQLGNGTTAQSSVPVRVAPLADVIEVAAGLSHVCARLSDGTVRCWGSGADGQLGNGGIANQPTPVRVSMIDDATRIVAGGSHTCALRGGGEVWCWGDGQHGQIGFGGTSDRPTPVRVGTIAGATQIAAGSAHTCAILADGRASCWGLNTNGQLGDGTFATRLTPSVVESGSSRFSQIEGGNKHSCAVTTAGTVQCWGNATGIGELAAGDDRASPTDVAGLSGITQISVGDNAGCALLDDRSVWCWGTGPYGQLGNGTRGDAPRPTRVVAP